MDFEQIVRAFSKHIFYTAFLYVKDSQAAEEITQDVFMIYYEKSAQFRQEASIKTYLTKIAVNRSHDYLRSWKNRKHMLLQKFHLDNLSTSTKDQGLTQEVIGEITEAILALPMKYKEVIILFYFNELKGREIANILGCSENTVHTRLKRAKSMLSQSPQLDGWEAILDESTKTKN